MAGQSSNLRASSSSRHARKLSEIGRDLDAARAKEPKRLRHSQPNATPHPSAAAVPVAPQLHYAASNSMAVAFPMAGVNGAALRWSTAVTLGAAARPAIAGGVNVPAAACAAAGPFVLAAAPVPVQVHFVAPAAAPAPAVVGLPLAAALDKMKSDTLGSMLSALMAACDPPAARQRQSWAGPPPPWWPSASAAWWAPEVVAHLHTIPVHTPVPYAPAYKLKKVQKVAALVAVVKHLSPDFDGIARKLQPAPPPPHGLALENVVDGGVAAAGGGELQVLNLAADASVTAAAGDGGHVVAVGEPEQEEGRDGDDGVVHGDDGGEQPADIVPGDINDAAAATGDFDQLLDDMLASYQVQQVQEVHQVVDAEAPGAEEAALELEAPGAEEEATKAPGAEEAAEAAPEGRPWYVEGGMSSIFDDFEMPVGGAPHSYY
ncbi:unnamed protein product [Urochloa decumbens]|uniref:Ethylene insensitive 3-like DNA-binding domain-containing protein n=1 Tax=Urochloa decumbens TaxID=240449 RepID=A0ABC9FQQ0_9POAL